MNAKIWMGRLKMMRIMLAALILLASVPFCNSEQYIYIEAQADLVDPMLPIVEVLKLKPVENSPYYESWVYGASEELPMHLYAYDAAGNVVYSAPLYTGGTAIPFSERIKNITIEDEMETYFSKTVNFCDHDGVCEYCENSACEIEDDTTECGVDCVSFENALVCDDCATGGKDDYCDLIKDGRCDPDCDNIDADCEGCEKRGCFYNDQVPSCGNYGGKMCSLTQKCSGDTISTYEHGEYADSCCLGDCIKRDESDDAMECRASGGEQCYSESACDGSSSIIGSMICCIGQCIDLSVEPKEPEMGFYGNDITSSEDLWQVEKEQRQNNAVWFDGQADITQTCGMMEGVTCQQWEVCNAKVLGYDSEERTCCSKECSDERTEFSAEHEKSLEEESRTEPKPFDIVIEEGSLIEIPGSILPIIIVAFLAIVVLTGTLYSVKKIRRRKEAINRIAYEHDYYRNLGYDETQTISLLERRGWNPEDIRKACRRR